MKPVNMYYSRHLKDFLNENSMEFHEDDGSISWVPIRPYGLTGLKWRLKCAWMVFTGRGDVIIWDD